MKDIKSLVRTLFIAVLVLGGALAIWRFTGGDVSGFFDWLGSFLFNAIKAVGDFFYNLGGMFGFGR